MGVCHSSTRSGTYEASSPAGSPRSSPDYTSTSPHSRHPSEPPDSHGVSTRFIQVDDTDKERTEQPQPTVQREEHETTNAAVQVKRVADIATVDGDSADSSSVSPSPSPDSVAARTPNGQSREPSSKHQNRRIPMKSGPAPLILPNNNASIDPQMVVPINPHSSAGSADAANNSSLSLGLDSADDGYYEDWERGSLEKPLRVAREVDLNAVHAKFEKWTRGELIGFGAYGRVFLGLNSNTGQLFAVKEVPLLKREGEDEAAPAPGMKKSRKDAAIAMLEQEIALMASLQHDNIVQYHGTERGESSLNIFLEYVPGGSIASLLRKFGRFNEGLVKLYTEQLLHGLAYLHSHQIIHRDIKGANLLIGLASANPAASPLTSSSSFTLKLSDFGAATRLADVLETEGPHSLKGSPYWMAPEVIKQTGHGRQSDIWSVGCTVIEMCTGKPPWIDQFPSHVSAMFQIATTDALPDLPNHITPECRHFIAACLQRDPKARPTAYRLLSHPWILGKPLAESSWTARGHLLADGQGSASTSTSIGAAQPTTGFTSTASSTSSEYSSLDPVPGVRPPIQAFVAPSTAPIRPSSSVHPVAVTRVVGHEIEIPRLRLSPSNSHSNLLNFNNFSQDLPSVSSSPVSRHARRLNGKSRNEPQSQNAASKEKPKVERSKERGSIIEERTEKGKEKDKEKEKEKEKDKEKEKEKDRKDRKDRLNLMLNLRPLDVGKKASESHVSESLLEGNSAHPSPSHSSRDQEARDSPIARQFESSHNDSPASRPPIAVRPFLPPEPSATSNAADSDFLRPFPAATAPSTAPSVSMKAYSSSPFGSSSGAPELADAGMIQNFLVESMAEKLEHLKENAQFYQQFKLKIVRATKQRKNSLPFVDQLDASLRPSSPNSVATNSGFSSSTAEYYAAPITPSLTGTTSASNSYRARFNLPSSGSDASSRHQLPTGVPKEVATRSTMAGKPGTVPVPSSASNYSHPSGRPLPHSASTNSLRRAAGKVTRDEVDAELDELRAELEHHQARDIRSTGSAGKKDGKPGASGASLSPTGSGTGGFFIRSSSAPSVADLENQEKISKPKKKIALKKK